DENLHALVTILITEHTPLSQGNANRFEVVRSDVTRLCHRLLTDRSCGPAFDSEGLRRSTAREGNGGRSSNRNDTRYGPDLFERLVQKSKHLVRLRIPGR